jgi:hypothetical protein
LNEIDVIKLRKIYSKMNEDLGKPFKLAFAIMKNAGMFHDGRQSRRYTIFGYIGIILITQIYWIQCLLYALKTPKFEESIEIGGHTMTNLAYMLKFWNFHLKLKKIIKSVDDLDDLLKFSEDLRWKSREVIKRRITSAIRIHKVFWGSGWITCFVASFTPFVNHEPSYKVWMPFDIESSGIYFWISSTYTSIVVLILSVTVITLDMIPVYFMAYAAGLTEELASRLRKIGDESSDPKKTPNMEKDLIKCIQIHQKIISFVGDVKENFSLAIFLQGFASSVIICSSAYAMSMVRTEIFFNKFAKFVF